MSESINNFEKQNTLTNTIQNPITNTIQNPITNPIQNPITNTIQNTITNTIRNNHILKEKIDLELVKNELRCSRCGSNHFNLSCLYY